MLFSSLCANTAVENYNKEKYGRDANGNYAILIIAIVMVVLELVLLYFALKIALASGQNTATKFINIVLAIFFTLPYLLLNMIFNKDASAELAFGFKRRRPSFKFF